MVNYYESIKPIKEQETKEKERAERIRSLMNEALGAKTAAADAQAKAAAESGTKADRIKYYANKYMSEAAADKQRNAEKEASKKRIEEKYAPLKDISAQNRNNIIQNAVDTAAAMSGASSGYSNMFKTPEPVSAPVKTGGGGGKFDGEAERETVSNLKYLLNANTPATEKLVEDVAKTADKVIPEPIQYAARRGALGTVGSIASMVDTATAIGKGIESAKNGGGFKSGYLDYLKSDSNNQAYVETQKEKTEAARRDNPNAVTNALGDLSESFGYMIPSLAASVVSGAAGIPAALTKIVSATPLAASGFASGTREALKNGATDNEALAYGALSAVIESAGEYAIGGVLGKGGGLIDTGLKKLGLDLTKNIANPAVKSLVNYGKSALGEGAEEVIQEALSVGARRLTYDENARINAGELAYAGLLGSLMGGIGSLPSGISNTISGARTVKDFKTIADNISFVAENGGINDAKTLADGMRTAWNGQIQAIEANKTYDGEQKELAAAPYKWMVQELDKLTSTLVSPEFKDAAYSAPATTEAVNGGELTKAEALEKNKNITDEIRNDNTLTTAEKKEYIDPIIAENVKINEMDDVRPESGEFDDAEGIREAMEEIAAEERAEATAKPEKIKAVEEPKAEPVKPETETVEPATEAQPLTEAPESGTIKTEEVPETVNAEEVQPAVEAEPVKEVALPEKEEAQPVPEVEQTVLETEEAAEQEIPAESKFKNDTLDISIKKHTKTGADLIVGKLSRNLSKEEYAEFNKAVKAAGGYYSKYAGGFVFPNEESLDKLRDVIGINDMRTAVQGAQDIQTAESTVGKESVGESSNAAQAVKESGTADVGETDSAVEAVRETVRKQAEEKNANNREAAPQDDNVVVPSEKEIADNKTVINTGNPLDMELYHGEGTPDSKKYASGVNYPVLGKGTYYAFSSKAAAFYGTVTKKRVRLKKAYAIHDDHDWSVLIKEIRNKFGGWKYMLPSYQSEENAITDMENVKKYLTSQGYDGVVVQYEADSSGDYNNRTRNSKRTIEKLFGGDQVVDYNAISIDSKSVEEIEPEPDKKAVTDNTVTAESSVEAETVEEQPQEAVEESANETSKANQDTERSIKAPKNLKGPDSLSKNAQKISDKIDDGASADDFKLADGKKYGFDLEQREYIADALVDGLKTDAEEIHVEVPRDGTLDINNNTRSVATVLDKLGASVPVAELSTMQKNALRYMASKDRLIYGSVGDNMFITDGTVGAVLPKDAADSFIKENIRKTEANARAAEIYKNVSNAEKIALERTAGYVNVPRMGVCVEISDTNGDKYVLTESQLNVLNVKKSTELAIAGINRGVSTVVATENGEVVAFSVARPESTIKDEIVRSATGSGKTEKVGLPYKKGYFDGTSAPAEVTKTVDKTAESVVDTAKSVDNQPKIVDESAKSEVITNHASQVANFVAGKLAKGEPITRNELNAYAEEAYGKKLADGGIDIKDINDAMELGMNRHLLSLNGDYTVDSLLKLTGLLPTQTNRTEDQIKLQQFSTPPAIAYTAAYAANIGKNDVVLEPSAGIGGIAVFAKNDGAKVHVNELDDRRLSIIKELPFDGFYNERGEQLHNILGDKFSPTVVVMNPPFSSSAVRNTKDIHEAAKHIESALKLLRDGGRLVAITGRGMNMEAPAFRKWWDDIKSEYNVRANIGLDGKNYTKYGTSFDIQLIVIDKNGPTTEDVLKGKVDNVNELYNMIGEIRNERTAAEPVRPVSGTESDDVRRMVGEKAENEARNNRGTEQKAVESTPDTANKGSVSEVSDTERSAGASADTGRSSGKESAESGGRTVRGNESADGRNLDENRRGGSVSASDGESVDGRRDGGMGVLRGTDGELRGSDERNSEQSGEDDIVKRTVKQPKTELTEDKYEEYVPQKLTVKGAKKHPTKLVESAAMATVKAPEMTETLHLPKKIVTDAILSDAQLEAVTRAWQSFGKTLDNDETQGYFIGDGTGVGKGREIAGIMYESFLRGQDKAVWITKGSNLLADAKRDLGAVIEGDTPILQLEGGKKLAKLDKFDKGVLFATYDTVGKEHKKNDSNLNALVNWLGKDFDGVIAFDEAHQMGNATGAKTSRGRSKPAEKAVACIELQRMLPKAKIVYVSATGATEVTNLAYAGRLGLWGMGTPFTSQEAFVSKIDAGGVAAMEVVARTLKARGKYIARNLSFDGVSYRRLTHNLDESQRETYDIAAKSWQVVIQNFNEALKVTGGNLNSKAKSNAAQRIWNSEQQFFEQLTTSIMTPALIEDARKQLEAGKSVVVQLTRTNEAQAEREAANAKKNDDGTLDLNETDFSCKGILEELVKNCFPVQEYEIVIDDLGNATSKPVEDSNKNPVLNAEAVKMRDKLLAQIGLLTLPDAPIDMIYRGLGEDVVTENTGRKKRFGLDENGNTAIIKLPANKDSFVNDFQDGRKRVMIFSEAGGTGKSYHADKNAKNQQQRIHYLLQPGWKANAAVQGFGRTLRSNQASAPEYVLMTTNVPAQARFISTIARRLDQLGALTKGQSNTGSQGIFSSSDNLEGEYARMSLRTLLSTLDRETLHEMGYDNLYDKQGHLNVSSDHLTNINRFLNRLFVLPLDKQPMVYNRFVSEMENRIQIAKDSGKYSDGVENYKAKRVEVNSKTAADIDSDYGTEVDYYVLDAYDDVVFNKFDKLQTQDERFRGFYKTPRGKVRAVFSAGTIVDDKTLNKVNAYSTVSVAGRPVRLMQGDISAWTKIDADEAETLWKEETAEHPKEAKTELHVVAGDLLQVWNQLPDTNISFKRILLDGGETIIGRVIPKKELDTTLRALNLDGKKQTYTAADAVKALNDGGFVQLAGGMRIERKRVANEYRYEFSGRIAPWQMATIKNQYGLFSENIQYVNRYFIPTDKAESIIEKLSKSYPIQEVYSAKEADAEYSLAHDGIMSDDEYVQELIDNVITPRGIEVVYDVDDSGVNAWYSDTSKKLHLNPNVKHSVTSILGHEIYHSLSQEDQNKIAYFFKTNSDTDSAEFKAWKEEIFELYEKKYAEDGKPFTDPDFWREYAAMSCESLFTDKQLVERLCGKSKTLGQRILDWIKNAWYTITGKSRYTTNRAVEAGKLTEKALRKAAMLYSDALGVKLTLKEQQIVKSSVPEAIASDIGFGDDVGGINYSLEADADITDTPTESTDNVTMEQFNEDFESAKVVPKSDPWYTKGKNALGEMFAKLTRADSLIPEHGVEAAYYAPLRRQIIRIRDNFVRSQNSSLTDIIGMMTYTDEKGKRKALSKEEANKFTRLVYLNDLAETAKIQRERGENVRLPKEYSEEDVHRLHDELVSSLTDTERAHINEALEKRAAVWKQLTSDYIKYNRMCGFDVSNRISRQAYYRHQVIDFMTDPQGHEKRYGKAAGMHLNDGRSFLKRRTGSERDINTDFASVEFLSLQQMHFDTEVAKALAKIKDKYDKKPEFVKRAKAKNQVEIDRIILREAREAMAADMRSKGEKVNDADIDKLEPLMKMVGDTPRPVSETNDQIMQYNRGMARSISQLTELANAGELDGYANTSGHRLALEQLKRGMINETVFDFMSEFVSENDNEAAIAARVFFKNSALKRQYIEEKLGDKFMTWERIAKDEGYVIFQPREGRYSYNTNALDESAAKKLAEQIAATVAKEEAVNLSTEEWNAIISTYAKQIRVMGQPYEQWAVKPLVTQVLNKNAMEAIAAKVNSSSFVNLYLNALRHWKGWVTAGNALRAAKYHIRNIIGDIEATLTADPGIMRMVPKAYTEIRDMLKNGKETDTYREWLELGGDTNLIGIQEMTETERRKYLPMFAEDLSTPKKVIAAVTKPFDTLSKYGEDLNRTRESVLRYASYLYYKDKLTKSDGRVTDFVASNRNIINGLDTIEEKAYQLSADALGNYADISEFGRQIRRGLIPFYSFTESNLRRYYRFFANPIISIAQGDSKAQNVKNLAKRMATPAVSAVILALINGVLNREADEKLPEDVRNRPHITFGEWGGNVYAFTRIGNVPELLEWVGLDDWKWTEDDLQAPIDKLWDSITPAIKVPFELATGESHYSDLDQPSVIRDRWEYLFNTFGLSDVYKGVTGKPVKNGLWDTIQNMAVYKYDTMESAYWDTVSHRYNFQQRANTSSDPTPKSNALYYMKQAIRYGEADKAKKYMKEYFENGGTGEGIVTSISNLNPEYGLTSEAKKEERQAWLDSMDDIEYEKYETAVLYYSKYLAMPEAYKKKLRKADNATAEALMNTYIDYVIGAQKTAGRK